MSTWTLKTDFGSIEVETDQIAGIKFNLSEVAPSKVLLELSSGRQWTGEVSRDEITVDCSWGRQTIKLSDLESITTHRTQQFHQHPGSGRWQLGPRQ